MRVLNVDMRIAHAGAQRIRVAAWRVLRSGSKKRSRCRTYDDSDAAGWRTLSQGAAPGYAQTRISFGWSFARVPIVYSCAELYMCADIVGAMGHVSTYRVMWFDVLKHALGALQARKTVTLTLRIL